VHETAWAFLSASSPGRDYVVKKNVLDLGQKRKRSAISESALNEVFLEEWYKNRGQRNVAHSLWDNTGAKSVKGGKKKSLWEVVR